MLTINRASSVSKSSDTWWKYRYLPPTRKYRQYRYLVSVSCPSLVKSLQMTICNWLHFNRLVPAQRDLQSTATLGSSLQRFQIGLSLRSQGSDNGWTFENTSQRLKAHLHDATSRIRFLLWRMYSSNYSEKLARLKFRS